MRTLLCLMLLTLSLLSHAENIFINAEFGRSELDLKANYNAEKFTAHQESQDNNFDNKVNMSTFDLACGYLFKNHFFIESGLLVSASDNFFSSFDDYKLYELKVSAGYIFKIAKHFNIVPKLGISRWELDIKEGKLLNAGKEKSEEFTGSDFYGQINFEVPISDIFTLYAGYTHLNYDFGKGHNGKIGIKFTF